MQDRDFLEIAKDFMKLVKGELQPYVSEEITVIVGGRNTVSVFTPAHMQYAKYGRGPGKTPPVDPILKWVSRKGIVFDNKTQEGTAWAIAKSISKNGTANFVPNAPNAIEEAIEKHNKDFTKAVSEKAGKITLEELQEVYKLAFPDKFKLNI